MNKPHLAFTMALLLGLSHRMALAAPPGPPLDDLRTAVAKSLLLLEKSAAEYTVHRECFSCHHQALPLLALTTAHRHGFAVRRKTVQEQAQFTADSLAKDREKYEQGRGQGGQADTAGYALLGLELGGWPSDATTTAVAEYLLRRDIGLDHWQVTSRRPPSEASSFTTTYLALRGLRSFGSPAQQERIKERVDKARHWLLVTPAKETEDGVFRLGALVLAGAADKTVQAATQALLRQQRADGGWSQTPELESDPYATGSALVMLHQPGGLSTEDPAYQRGLEFLLRAQRADGSWQVASRSKPFQTYFESGFPHGKDQFISIAASSWATAALALALPVAASEDAGTERAP